MKAFLILEDGTVFTGIHIGVQKEIISEIVFNTSMTGYLEVLTDPSYAGQAVTMTYPLIGNYGVCHQDMESDRAWPDGFLVRELSRRSSNFRQEEELEKFLKTNGIPGIAGIDTRALTKRLREKGTMNGMITTREIADIASILPEIRAYTPKGVVRRVTCTEKKCFVPGELDTKPVLVKKKVALLDLGTKKNIIRSLLNRGCEVTVYPAYTSSAEILNEGFDGIMLSNGPGDPKECTEIIEEVRKLYESSVPIFAICLGHQLMALANGADTYKMKYGHRGANHPVKDLETGKVVISSQNHGYVVNPETLPSDRANVSFCNVNDGTVEGVRYCGKKVFTVQFHPEACAGPQDSAFLFDKFIEML